MPSIFRKTALRPILVVLIALAALAMEGCKRRPTPVEYDLGEPLNFVPEHLDVDQEEYLEGDAPLRPEFFERYQPQKEEYTISIGDVLEVSIFGHDDTLVEQAVIAPDGRLYYMFLDGVDAAGRTLDDLASEIRERVGHLFINPEVTIIPKRIAARTYRVLGKVTHPGVFPIISSVNLRQAIGEAGGIELGGFRGTTINIANFRRSFMVRGGEKLRINFERLLYTEGSDQNVYMRPGDYVYIASSLVQEVFLLGSVFEQKPIPYKDGLTLMAALSGVTGITGGFLPNADRSRVIVVRGSLENPEPIYADVIAIVEGRAKDIYLLPGDIVFVPEKRFRYGRELVRLAVNSFVRAFGGAAGGHYGRKHWFSGKTTP